MQHNVGNRWAGRGNLACTSMVLAAAVLFVSLPRLAWAGPPFIADDPEPVELHHWELYLASQTAISKDEKAGTAPHIEFNYGILPETQFHVIAPFAYTTGSDVGSQYGFGDTELGVKYRFIKETETLPQVGTFPMLEIPTGDPDRGLGNGQPQAFFPLWAQKSFGKWTTYGGGGYWLNPGEGNKNFWLAAWELQRKITDNLTLGGEAYFSTPSAQGESNRVGFNLGGIFDFTENYHLLFSCGHDIHGPNAVIAYLGFQITF